MEKVDYPFFGFLRPICYLLILSLILLSLFTWYKNKKIILLDNKYIISEIDRVIELKSNLENEIHKIKLSKDTVFKN